MSGERDDAQGCANGAAVIVALLWLGFVLANILGGLQDVRARLDRLEAAHPEVVGDE